MIFRTLWAAGTAVGFYFVFQIFPAVAFAAFAFLVLFGGATMDEKKVDK